MTKGIKGVALAITATALSGGLSVAPISAEDPGDATRVEILTPPAEATVVVVNNHLYAVTVVAVDASGVQHRLGTLGRQGTETFSIPESVVDWEGGALIKVYPIAPIPGLGHSLDSPDGIKTRISVLDEGQTIFWLEPDLNKSFTQKVEG